MMKNEFSERDAHTALIINFLETLWGSHKIRPTKTKGISGIEGVEIFFFNKKSMMEFSVEIWKEKERFFIKNNDSKEEVYSLATLISKVLFFKDLDLDIEE